MNSRQTQMNDIYQNINSTDIYTADEKADQ
jgi:hypothetical protein